MKINRNNYEAFFLDYLEGNLDENLVDDFIEFLTLNPDLKEELSLFEPVSLQPEEMNFERKELLFHHRFDNENEFNRVAVAQFEGDLNPLEISEFEDYLSEHPERNKDIGLFAQSKLVADQSVVFPDKKRLYRRPVVKSVFLWSSRVAAVLILAVAVYWFLGNERPNTEQLAKNDNAKTEITQSQEVPSQPAKTLEVPDKTGTMEMDPAPQRELIQNKVAEKFSEPNKDLLADSRLPVETMSKLKHIGASVKVGRPETMLQPVALKQPKQVPDERYFAEMVAEKSGLNNFSLKKVVRAGLNLVSKVTDDKFRYQTNEKNEVKEVEFESRLLAFTIPTSKATVSNSKDGE